MNKYKWTKDSIKEFISLYKDENITTNDVREKLGINQGQLSRMRTLCTKSGLKFPHKGGRNSQTLTDLIKEVIAEA